MENMNELTVINDNEWISKTTKELKLIAENYFDLHFKQKNVTNKSTGFEITLAKKGFDHTLKCNDWTYINLVVFKKLDEVIQNAIFYEIGFPSEKEKKKGTVLFYNFKSAVAVNGIEHCIKITIREHIEQGKVGKKLKFYYDHYKMK